MSNEKQDKTVPGNVTISQPDVVSTVEPPKHGITQDVPGGTSGDVLAPKHRPKLSLGTNLAQDWVGPKFDIQTSAETVNNAVAVLRDMIDALRVKDWNAIKASDLAKDANHLAKTIDGVARLCELIKGNPDSRPEIKGLDELLTALTSDQLKQFESWITPDAPSVH